MIGFILALATTVVPAPPRVYVAMGKYHQQIAAPAIPESKDTSPYSIKGNWHIRIDKTVDNGCFANIIYDDYTYIRVELMPNTKTIAFYIGNRLWRSIDAESKKSISIKLGDFTPWTGEGVGSVSGEVHYLGLRISDADFLTEMRKSGTALIKSDEKEIGNFSLAGADAALTELGACQNYANAAADPFAKK